VGLRTVGVQASSPRCPITSRNMRNSGKVTKDFVSEMDRAAKAGKLDAVADRRRHCRFRVEPAWPRWRSSPPPTSTSPCRASRPPRMPSSATSMQAAQGRARRRQGHQYSATRGGRRHHRAVQGRRLDRRRPRRRPEGRAEPGRRRPAGRRRGRRDRGQRDDPVQAVKGDQVPHVADLLAAAAGKAQGSVHDMGHALNQSGLVAAQFGLSIEDTTGVLAEFAERRPHRLRRRYSLQDDAARYGQPVVCHQGQDERVEHLASTTPRETSSACPAWPQQLQDRLQGLDSQETRQSALSQLFGNDAVRAASDPLRRRRRGRREVEEQRQRRRIRGRDGADPDRQPDRGHRAAERARSKPWLSSPAAGASGGLRALVKGVNALVDQFCHCRHR
jgi:hypothetical protein